MDAHYLNLNLVCHRFTEILVTRMFLKLFGQQIKQKKLVRQIESAPKLL